METAPLSTLRRRLGLTQTQAAYELDLSRRQIQAYEMGEEGHLKRVIALALTALTVCPEYRITDAGRKDD